MKIIQVQTQAEAAGAQRVSDMVGAGLRARGHEVRTVFMYRKTDVYDDDPHADFILKTRPGGLLGQMRAAWGLIKYLRAERPDAVISYQYWGNLFGTIGGRLAGAQKLVVNQSGRPLQSGVLGLVCRFEKLMGQWGWFHHSVVNSTWTQKQFARYPDSYKERLVLIEHGVVAPKGFVHKGAARKAFELPLDVPLVVTTGRQTHDKNQGALVEALSGIAGAHLAIAGVGPLFDELVEMANRLGVSDRLHMVGEVKPENIHTFLAAGDVFGFASLDETFGLSVAEAAIAGLPIVANDLSVLREVLINRDGKPAALFVRPPDGRTFALAITKVLRDKNLSKELSEAGRDLKAKYDPDIMCAAYEKLLI